MRTRWVTASASAAARRAVADRPALVVLVPFYATVVAALAGLWRVAVEANGGSVAGYSAAAVTWYLAATEACVMSLDMRMIEDVGRDITSGAVATELLRPAPVVGVRIVAAFGRALPRLAMCLTVGGVLASVSVGASPRPVTLLVAVPSFALAIACNIVCQHAFAAAAFWLRDAGSAWFLYQKFVFIVGGMLIPLEALPGWLGRVAAVLPFRAMAYTPARLASGHLEPVLLIEQVVWLVMLSAGAAAAFRAGERRLQVVGG